ncbi:MAG TPA: M20 family metallopeptidase [Luteitalea sp.]|nr:M20 family metallopeptidase [Luteitalea sp.]
MSDRLDLRDACAARAAWMTTTVAALARLESPSGDVPRLAACADALTDLMREIGADVERLPSPAGEHLRATIGTGSRQILLLGHYDTVWGAGTVDRMPVEIVDGRLHGPGTFDMKAGLVIALTAASLVRPQLHDVRLRCLFTADEEVGSTTSRALIEAEARDSAAVLVFEPALPGGVLKTSRKGVGTFRLEARGVPAHAGIAPQDGASAVLEVARQVVALDALAAPSLGTTVNTGVIAGGTRTNVVAEEALIDIDVRVTASAEQQRIESAWAALTPVDSRVRLTRSGSFERPPLERGPHVAQLFALAQRAGASVGLDVREGSTGGASDGNFTAALGVPTLDGLGAIGAGAHARHEHVEIASLPERAALAAAIILALDA